MEAMTEFNEEIQELLAGSNLLVSTDGGKLLYGPSVLKFDNVYPFLNEYDALYSPGAGLAEKLQIYREQF